MLPPDSVVVQPQTGTGYSHMEHPQENHSKNLCEINPSAGRRSSEHENDEGESRRRRIANPAGPRAAVAGSQSALHGPARLTSNQQCLQDSSCIFSVGRYSRCAAKAHFCYLLFEEVVFVGFSLSFRVWVWGVHCPGMAPADN